MLARQKQQKVDIEYKNEIKVFIQKKEKKMWGPSMRECSRLSYIGDKLYLFGGIGSEMALGVSEY